MNLMLSAVTHNDHRLTSPITAVFDAAGGTVGRADHCTLALPDPERFISRKQAEVVAVTGGLFLIRNVGSANPIVIGQRSLEMNESAVLQDGDLVRIAGYELQVNYTAEVPPPQPVALQRSQGGTAAPVLAVPPSPAQVARPVTVTGAAAGNPFADLLAPAPQRDAPPPQPVAPQRSQGPAAAPALAVPPPSAPVARPVAPPVTVSGAAAGNPFADLLAPAPQLDALPPQVVPLQRSQTPAAAMDLLIPPPPPPARTAAPLAPAAGGNPFADLLAPAPQFGSASPRPGASADLGMGGGNPFAGLLDSASPPVNGAGSLDLLKAPPPPPRAREPDIVPAAAGMSAAAWQAPASPKQLPDDFDPFSLPAVSGRGSAPPVDPFGLVQPSRSPSIDQQFGLASSTEGRDPLGDFMKPPVVDVFSGSLGMEPAAPDILAALAPPPPAAHVPIGASDRLDPLHDAFEPPRLTPSAKVERPAPQPQPPSAGAPDVAGLWLAFCRGAEIQASMPADEVQLAQRMEHVGRILKAAVAGTQELMAVRASTKYEMRAQVTQIQARSNNPLKFAPDVRTGVEQLVEPATRGFLEGPAAMEDAMKDLIGHMIGSVAGMRAALEGLLDRFTPEMLEQTLGQGSMLDSLLPASRKSKLWELYLLRYTTLRESAQDDFHAVFGKAFLAAYEQQIERLRKKGGQP